MKKIIIGAHVSFLKNTQLLGTVEEMIAIGATSGGIYISNSRGYLKTYPIDKQLTMKAHKLAQEHGINLKNLIVHAPMVGNLANADKESNTFMLTVKSYTEDLKRLETAGLKYYNFHPGSFPDKSKAIKQCTNGINQILNKTKTLKTIMLIETVTAKGNLIGSTFEEIKQIIDGVKDKERIGVCMDTCHVWDAGYDIKSDLKNVLKKFDKVIGLKYLKGLHINDSKNEKGSNKDRHEAIGKGKIGLKALKEFVNHPKLRNLPKDIETPYTDDNIDKWKKEIEILTK